MKKNSTKRALLSSILALCICFTMLVGTTFAWFTDNVTSDNNIIKTGKLDVAMYWAKGGEAVPAIGAEAWTDASSGPIFKDDVLWEPGYVDAKHILIANEGSLDLNYELRITTNTYLSELANVIDVYYFANATQLTRATVESGEYLGTLADIMGTAKNISNTVKGSLVVSDDDETNDTTTLTLAFKMQESADNHYQELSLASFSVQLIATQMASESDSFGSNYDNVALSPAVPAAVVTRISPDSEFSFTKEGETTPTVVLQKGLKATATVGIGGSAEELKLNAAFQFEPSETLESALLSEYKYYVADFEVSADRDIPADSIALAGYYDAWCGALNNDNWVSLNNENAPIDANTTLRLVQMLGGDSIKVHYKDLCEYANDGVGFVCGLADLSDGANAGTTVTVKLCLYKTDADPNGGSASNTEVEDAEPIVIGTFQYKFPAAEAASQADLEEALESGANEVTVAAGTYTFPANKLDKDVTIVCEEGTVFDGGTSLNISGATVVGATFTNDNDYLVYSNTINGTFKDCVFTDCDGLRYCYAGENVVFENCVFDTDFYGIHFDGGANEVVFKGCTFTGFNTFGSAITKLTMEDCTFKYNGKGGYNGVNLWGNSELTNCTFVFDGSASYEWVDACGDNATLTFTGCVISDGTTERALTASDVGDYGTGNTITVQ